jgi:hypothetical protein
MEPKPMHPSSSRAFQRHQEHDLKHSGSLDLITTKQNKLPSFIDNLGGALGKQEMRNLGCEKYCCKAKCQVWREAALSNNVENLR